MTKKQQPQTATVGQTLSHYRLLEKLGEGGMGTVYSAEDRQLGRRVALKLLTAPLASENSSVQRLQREAQVVAALSHPNIVTIHSIETSDDYHFITMELVQGKSLEHIVPTDGLAAERVVEIGLPLASALAEAHRAGVTHRDLKPANVMITGSEVVKVLDFGIAKLQRSSDEAVTAMETLTQAGTVVGTVSYMSPEQLRGDAVDQRTDIYSLGVTLYEMATGRRPYRGESSAALISAILRDPPTPLTEVRSDLPDSLERIIMRCLEKDPELRYQAAADIETALQKLSEGFDAEPKETAPSVAVLPFLDLSPEKDQAYFCEGLAEELIHALAKVEGLRIASRTSAFRFGGGESDIREIGRRLGVGTVLEGSVRKSGDQVRVSVQLVNVEDGYHLWSNRFDRELKDVFAIQDEIAESVVEALQVTLGPQAREAVEKAAPVEFQAYDYYLKGRKHFYEFNQTGFELARQMFARAIVIDDEYARAYAGVADCCSFLYIYYEANEENLREAESASRKAAEIDPESAEAHASRGLALSVSGHYEEAEAEFERAIELNPKLYEAHYFQGRARAADGRPEAAVESFKRACEVNPEDYQAPIFLAQTYVGLGRRALAAATYRRAIEAVKKHLAFNPDDPRALYLGAACLVELGELEDGQEWAARALEFGPDDALTLYNVPCVYAQLDEKASALDCLERAIDSGMGEIDWIRNDPYFDPLREHPRFQELLERVAPRTGSITLGE